MVCHRHVMWLEDWGISHVTSSSAAFAIIESIVQIVLGQIGTRVIRGPEIS